jgi:peptidoglycan/LPS O-acetylase OafA/YrhL
VLPLFLLIAPTRWRTTLITAALLSSVALCVLLVSHKPSATFFLLPTRVWELMIGSFLAVIVAKQPDLDAPGPLRLAAIAIILIIPFFPLDQLHPRFDAVLVSNGSPSDGPGRMVPALAHTRALSLAGDWSYSILFGALATLCLCGECVRW